MVSGERQVTSDESRSTDREPREANDQRGPNLADQARPVERAATARGRATHGQTGAKEASGETLWLGREQNEVVRGLLFVSLLLSRRPDLDLQG